MMMATRPIPPHPPAAPTFKPSTRRFSSRSATRGGASPKRSNRLPAFVSRPSGDLPGRSVALSADVPAIFDATLAPHHKLVGRWVAERETEPKRYTRQGARERIEKVFGAAVLDIMTPVEMVDLNVIALVGDGDLPPALAVVCNSIGEIDLGWITKANVLANTLAGHVAPVGWRAAAYKAIGETLNAALPVFGFDDLMEEFAAYNWDGETDDEGARATIIAYHGDSAFEENDFTLPSQMYARRPDWMTAQPAPLRDMPADLRNSLRRLRDTHAALKAIDRNSNAWAADYEHVFDYIPGMQDCGTLPPLTIVPFDHFAREIDDVARFGMEQGFYDVAGLCPLADAAAIDTWFASLKVGVEFLLAAQHLISLDPANPRKQQ